MSRIKLAAPKADTWAALLLYLLGFFYLGVLLAMPSAPAPGIVPLGVVVGTIVLAWAGSDAGAGFRSRGFLVAALGAAILAGTLGWAASEARVVSSAVTGAFIWSIAWIVAVAEEEAFLMAVALVIMAVIAGVINLAVLVIGVIFSFMTCTSPEVGERLGHFCSSTATFLILATIAGFGMGLGWIWQRVF